MRSRPSFVYLIRAGDFCKIGKANDINSRLRQISTASPFPVSVAMVTKCSSEDLAFSVEKDLHREYSHRRQNGEWFLHHHDIELHFTSLGDERGKLSNSDLDCWFSRFEGLIPAGGKLPGVGRISLPEGGSMGYLQMPSEAGNGFELGFTENLAFYQRTPGGLLIIDPDGHYIYTSQERLDREYRLSQGLESVMFREAEVMLTELVRAGVVGRVNTGAIYDIAEAVLPNYPGTDSNPIDRRIYDDGRQALDTLAVMDYIVPVAWNCLMFPDEPAYVFAVPAPQFRATVRPKTPKWGR